MLIGNFEKSREYLEAVAAIAPKGHIGSILGRITKAIVIKFVPLFLIRGTARTVILLE